jgi:hypothetical protein
MQRKYMTELEVSSKPKHGKSCSSKSTVGCLFVLDLSGGRSLSIEKLRDKFRMLASKG